MTQKSGPSEKKSVKSATVDPRRRGNLGFLVNAMGGFNAIFIPNGTGLGKKGSMKGLKMGVLSVDDIWKSLT